MNHVRNLGLHVFIGLACQVIILSTGSNAWAVLLAYEGFDYTAGEFLVVSDASGTPVAPIHDGGFGWAGPWDDSQGLPPAGVTHTDSIIQANSLQFTDSLGNALVTTGGKMLNSGGGDNGSGPGTLTSQPGRTLATRRASSAEGATFSTWISFLGQRVGDVNADGGAFDGTYRRGANLAFFDLGGTASQPEKLNIGESSNQQYPLGGDPPMYEDRFQTRLPGVPGTVTVAHPFPQNPEGSATSNVNGAQVRDGFSDAKFQDVSLIVIRIDHVTGDSNDAVFPEGGTYGGNDNIHVWTNPILGSTPSDASASIKHLAADIVAAANALATPVAPFNGDPFTAGSGSGGEFDFDRLRLFAGNNSGTTPFAQWLFDEVRVGETFADVTPFVPAVAGLPGDYNGDMKVDAADYTVWRDNLGALTEDALNGNGDGMGGVDIGDYTLWKNNFGNTPPGSGSASVVPEPGAVVLSVLALVLGAGRRRRSRVQVGG